MKGMRKLALFTVAGIALIVSSTAAGAGGPGKAASVTADSVGTPVADNTASIAKAGAVGGFPTMDLSGKAALADLLPTAPRFYTIVNSGFLSNPSGSQSGGSVFCASGRVAWGGGGFGSSTSLAQNINSSYPIVSGGLSIGWHVDMNNGGPSSSFVVYAVCAKQPRNGYVVAAATFSNPPGQTFTSVGCPVGSNSRVGKSLGGGSFGSSASLSQNINSTYPVGTSGWHTDMNNATSSTLSTTVYVVCGKRKGLMHVVGAAVSNPSGSQTFASVGCPAGLVTTGGGGFSSSVSTAVNMNSTYPPSSTAWAVFENNASAGAASITPHAICVQ